MRHWIFLLVLSGLTLAQTPKPKPSVIKLPQKGLTAMVISHSVALSWSEDLTQGTVTGYKVYRGNVSGGPYNTVACALTSNTPTTCADASGLVEGSTYYYVATATGPGGESTYSNEASVLIPFQKPPAPTALTAAPH